MRHPNKMDDSEYLDKRLELPADTVTEAGMKKYRVREQEFLRKQVQPWDGGPRNGWKAVVVKGAWKDFTDLPDIEIDGVESAMSELLSNPFGKNVRRLMPSTDRYRYRMTAGSIVFDLDAVNELVIVLRISVRTANSGESVTVIVGEESD